MELGHVLGERHGDANGDEDTAFTA